MTRIALVESGRGRSRHDHVVRRFSRDLDLLRHLDRLLVLDRDLTASIVRSACDTLHVPPPTLLIRTNRRPDTGACDPPRRRLVALLGEERVRRAEAGGFVTHPDGRIRLGARTLAGTIAHELGHHLVNHTARSRAPAHGKAWVAAYDAAAGTIIGHPAMQFGPPPIQGAFPTLDP